MTNWQKQLIIMASSILVAGIYLRTHLPTTTTETTPITIAELTATSSATTSLTLSIDQATGSVIRVDDEILYNLKADSGSDHVTGIQLDFNYDPTRLQFVSMTPSSLFPVTLSGIVHDANTSPTIGRFMATYGVAPSSGGVTGDNLVANLKFKAIQAGPTSVELGNRTYVSGTSNYADSVLHDVASPTLTIQPAATADPSSRSSCNIAVYKMPYTSDEINSHTSLDSNEYLKPEYRIADTTNAYPVQRGELFAYAVEVTNTSSAELSFIDNGYNFTLSPASQNNYFQYIGRRANSCLTTGASCKIDSTTLSPNSTVVLQPFVLTYIERNWPLTDSSDSSTTTVKFFGKTCGSFTVTSPILFHGDLNADGHVNLADYNILIASYGTTYTLADYNKIVANYGK